MITTSPVTVLHGDFDVEGDANSMRALLFGLLADRAFPIVEHYRSDLYHDANWLRRYVTGPGVFFFAVRTSGTSIGDDERLVSLYNDHAYRVELVAHPRNDEAAKWNRWNVYITEMSNAVS